MLQSRLHSLAWLTSPGNLRFHLKLPRGGQTHLEAKIHGRDLHLLDFALLHPDAMCAGVVGSHIAISTTIRASSEWCGEYVRRREDISSYPYGLTFATQDCAIFLGVVWAVNAFDILLRTAIAGTLSMFCSYCPGELTPRNRSCCASPCIRNLGEGLEGPRPCWIHSTRLAGHTNSEFPIVTRSHPYLRRTG